MNNRLEQQMQFILEIDKLKKIGRQTFLSDASRKENDAEHSWHLAMMCLLLSEHANKEVDVLRVMSMVLIHDIIEIDAGDTYAYDDAGNSTKRERELKAAERLFNILPEDQAKYMRDLWDEFEEGKTPEAQFACTLDRMQPTMLNDASGGIAWNEHQVKISQILGRNTDTAKGSEKLWNYSLYRYIKPNIDKGNIIYDTENIDLERFELAYLRIKDIPNDNMNMSDKYKDFFIWMSDIFSAYYECIHHIKDNCYKYAGPVTRWYKNIDITEWQRLNNLVNRYRYDSELYKESYANPEYAVKCLGDKLGKLLTFVAAEVSSLGVYCFEQRYFDLTITAELFLEIYDIFENHEESSYEGAIKSAIYYYVNDYMDDLCEFRVRDMLDENCTFFTDIVMNMDMSDERSLYMYGENISYNELESFRYINSLSEEEIDKIAIAYTEGYRKSFELAGIDLSKKKTVQVRYPVGFERIVRRSIELFDKMGLKPVIYRNAVGKQHIGLSATGCIDTNPQFAYDHRYDKAIYFNKAMKDRQLTSLKNAYEKYKVQAKYYAGPAVIEYFGEKDFKPVTKSEANSLSDVQKELTVEYSTNAGQLVNNYIRHDDYSFTIIAFPLPEIGNDYNAIFKDTIRINTLDTALFERVQQKLIDTLDDCEYVHIVGNNDNNTDLKINLATISNHDTETRFHNCLADCNIPVGEVYTSPKLTGTEGILNVNEVYINGLKYENLTIEFNDGVTGKFTCSNGDDEQGNINFVSENLMKQHKSLPMGEFAIGTNTAAYAMGKKYGISGKLPILIAEKTGPHIAIGDTCFSMSEEVPVYNPDGKEVIARENEFSVKRHDDPVKAYFSCHTDITIPYNELGLIEAVKADGSTVSIIENGKFVLDGTIELNDFI